MGVLGLGEALPSTLVLGALRLSAWALILLGTAALASGQGETLCRLQSCCMLCAASLYGFGACETAGMAMQRFWFAQTINCLHRTDSLLW